MAGQRWPFCGPHGGGWPLRAVRCCLFSRVDFGCVLAWDVVECYIRTLINCLTFARPEDDASLEIIEQNVPEFCAVARFHSPMFDLNNESTS